MGERLRQLGRFLWRVVRTVLGWLGRLGGWLGRAVAKTWHVASLERRVRAEERRRAEVLQNLGKMVYLLSKRNLVRNGDLLAECEKIVAIDAGLDALLAAADRARLAGPLRAEPDLPVAATPVEMPWAPTSSESSDAASAAPI